MFITRAGYAGRLWNDPVKRSASRAGQNVQPNVKYVSQVPALGVVRSARWAILGYWAGWCGLLVSPHTLAS